MTAPQNAVQRLLHRWADEYSDDQGIWPLWSSWSDEATPYSEIVREFHPLTWRLGVDVQHQTASPRWPRWWMFGVTAGPWSLYFRREWPS